MEARPGDQTSTIHCTKCGAALALDQRYCVECGARRGSLPRHINALIGAILEQGRPVKAPGRPRAEPVAGSGDLAPWAPPPRAAAAAILGMLAFGVVVGSLVSGGGLASLVRPLLVAVSQPSSHASPTAGGSPPGGASSSGGGSGNGSGSSGGSSGSSASASGSAQSPDTLESSSGSGDAGGSSSPDNLLGLPPVKHVFLIVLSNQGYRQTFGSKDKYFAKTLPEQGELLENYYAVTAGPLANAIGLISGQGPTQQTATDCPRFADITPAGKGKMGQVLGSGCVYPHRTENLADQLSAAKHGGWKAYVEGLDNGPKGTAKTCRHPALGTSDGDQAPAPQDPYVTWRNPFVYFHSLIDGTACHKADAGLTRLARDLKAASTTPALSYIAPSPCDDGDPQPCRRGAPAGLSAADKFLKSVVPEIEHSPAYKADGMIAITFDQAPQTGPDADPSSCCDAQAFPNLPSTTTTTTATTPTPTTPTGTAPTATTPPPTATSTTTIPATPTGTTTTPTTPTTTTPDLGSGGETNPTGGGGQVGLLLISKYVKPGSVDVLEYFNHFSLLRSIEDIFGVGHLGYASDPSLPEFDAAVFNNPNG